MSKRPLEDSDFIGKEFGSWTVLEVGEPNSEGRKRYLCRCSCGALSHIRGAGLKNGETRCCLSCSQRGNKKGLTHGHMVGARQGGASLTYRSWKSMIQRCHNPGALAYEDYGARGIRVFDEWRGEAGFASFLAHIGERPSPGYTLDRIDNSKGYEPGNVRWATYKQQQRNRGDNQVLTLGDVTKTIYEWSETTGLSHGVIRGRMRLGWSAEDILQTPRLSKTESGKRSALARNKKSSRP